MSVRASSWHRWTGSRSCWRGTSPMQRTKRKAPGHEHLKPILPSTRHHLVSSTWSKSSTKPVAALTLLTDSFFSHQEDKNRAVPAKVTATRVVGRPRLFCGRGFYWYRVPCIRPNGPPWLRFCTPAQLQRYIFDITSDVSLVSSDVRVARFSLSRCCVHSEPKYPVRPSVLTSTLLLVAVCWCWLYNATPRSLSLLPRREHSAFRELISSQFGHHTSHRNTHTHIHTHTYIH